MSGEAAGVEQRRVRGAEPSREAAAVVGHPRAAAALPRSSWKLEFTQ
jgi:hypothetical protein